MKKFRNILIVSISIMLLIACSSPLDSPEGPKKLKIVFVNSTDLGDNSLGDVLWRGVTEAAKDFDFDATAVELGGDATKYTPTLEELAETGEYDVIIAGTFSMKEAIEIAAKEYPEQKFIAFDTEFDHSNGEYDNVVSFLFAQNEGAFLGGALASLMTTSGHEFTNPEKIIGYVGGKENTALQDFLVGYIEGAKYVDDETKILFSFIGNFTDSAAAKELSLAQYNQGADVVFGVAASAGLGVMDASSEMNRFSLGVDMDQGTAMLENNPKTANHVLSSVQKNMDTTIYELIEEQIKGTLTYGENRYFGVSEGGMSLSNNEIYQKHVPQEFQDQIKEIEEKILLGEIKVSSAFDLTQEELESIKKNAGK